MVSQDIAPALWESFCDHFSRTHRGRRIGRLHVWQALWQPASRGAGEGAEPAVLRRFESLSLETSAEQAISVVLMWSDADGDSRRIAVVRPCLFRLDRPEGHCCVTVESVSSGGFAIALAGT